MARHVVVVGGGIVGAMIATRILKDHADVRLTLVDAGRVGGGASLHSAGVHFPVGRTPRIQTLGELGSQYYLGLLRAHPDLPIRPFEMRVHAAARHAAEVEARCVGLDAAALDEGSGGAVWRLPGCHVSDVPQLVQWHVARLRRSAEVLEGAAVLGIEVSAPGADGLRLRLSSGRDLRADAVVLAPGPWANEPPFQEHTASLGIRIKKVVALHIDLPTDRGDALYFPMEDAFLVPLTERGHWLFSYTCPQWDVTPQALSRPGLGATEIEEAREVAARVAPHLVPHLRSGRVFCDAYSPAREPLVRGLDADGRLVFAGACNGSGFRLAPGIAIEVSELLSSNPAH